MDSFAPVQIRFNGCFSVFRSFASIWTQKLETKLPCPFLLHLLMSLDLMAYRVWKHFTSGTDPKRKIQFLSLHYMYLFIKFTGQGSWAHGGWTSTDRRSLLFSNPLIRLTASFIYFCFIYFPQLIIKGKSCPFKLDLHLFPSPPFQLAMEITWIFFFYLLLPACLYKRL